MALKFRNQRLSRSLLGLLASGCLVWSSLCLAEISYLDMKGVHSLIQPHFQHLSPIYGYTLLATRTLENLRFYGNYGPEKEGFACMEKASQIRELLVKNQDCPQDKTAELIQRLFPSQDGVNFVHNQVASDPASQLSPEVIGRVLGHLAALDDAEWMDPEKTKVRVLELRDILYQSGKKSEYEKLAQLFVDAIKESRLLPKTYPRYLPEQVLLAYFWKKSNDKQDLVKLLGQMAPVSVTISAEKKQEFLTQKYSEKDFDSQNFTGDLKSVAQRLMNDPERLVFYVQQDAQRLKSMPPILSYSTAKHSSLDGKTYADCGGTSLRNFFNIVLYDSKVGKFNAGLLTQLQKKTAGLHPHPNLISFYQNHFEPAEAATQDVRDQWSEKVASGQPGVNYLKPKAAPQCEINAGIDNMMVLIRRLLFYGIPDSNKSSGFINAKSRVERMNELCKIFSREGFHLDWTLEGSLDRTKLNEMNLGSIRFSINSVPAFIWQFQERHFAIQDITQTQESWKDQSIEEVAKLLAAPGSSYSRLLLLWFVTEKNWDRLVTHFQNEALTPEQIASNQASNALLFYSIPLSSTEVKILTLEKIVQQRFSLFYEKAKRLQSMILPDDLDSQIKISIVLSNADYPWGAPEHAYGNPEARYVQLSKSLDWQSHLASLHNSGFKDAFGKAWQDPRGLIWGQEICGKDGLIRKMDQREAHSYCKKIGARLPTIKEWQALGSDLRGVGTDAFYFPQFLSQLWGNSFWSSSMEGAVSGYYFRGSEGSTDYVSKYQLNVARCVISN